MSVLSSWKNYMRFMNGLTAVMFLATLVIVEIMFMGYFDDLGGSTAVFRAAVPNTVVPAIATGLLIGHWFHPGSYGPDLLTYLGWTNWSKFGGFVVALIICVVVSAVGLGLYAGSIVNDNLSFYFPGWTMLALGLLVGSVFWPVAKLEETRPEWREAHGLTPVQPTEGEVRTAFWLLVSFAAGWVLVAGGMVAAAVLDQVGWGIVAAGAFWLAFILVSDIFLVVNKKAGDTWSEQLRDWGQNVTTFPPWVFGVLAGRWYHPFEPGRFVDETVGIVLVIVATLLVVGAGVALELGGDRMRYAPPWLVTVLGMIAGAVLIPAQFPEPLTSG